jgi:predicted NBD/HSP70 family sugar kinase
MNSDDNLKTCAIGLDVGGTKTAGGVVAFPTGRVLYKQTIPTRPERQGEAVLTDVLDFTKTLPTFLTSPKR